MKFLIAIMCCVCFCYSAFDEDSYLFEAVDYEAQSQFDKARDLYLVLYEEIHLILQLIILHRVGKKI